MGSIKYLRGIIIVSILAFLVIRSGVLKKITKKDTAVSPSSKILHEEPVKEKLKVKTAGKYPQTVPNSSGKKQAAVEKEDKKPKKEIFLSNEEILEEYGRLEQVVLRDGQKYIGVVVSTSGIYTIITVEGKISIQMKNIKERVIIR